MKKNALTVAVTSIAWAVVFLISTIAGLVCWLFKYEIPRSKLAKIQLRMAELDLAEKEKGSADAEPIV